MEAMRRRESSNTSSNQGTTTPRVSSPSSRFDIVGLAVKSSGNRQESAMTSSQEAMKVSRAREKALSNVDFCRYNPRP